MERYLGKLWSEREAITEAEFESKPNLDGFLASVSRDEEISTMHAGFSERYREVRRALVELLGDELVAGPRPSAVPAKLKLDRRRQPICRKCEDLAAGMAPGVFDTTIPVFTSSDRAPNCARVPG